MHIHKNRKMMSEVNVTPMVDVMLVLLVIFMVTAPMMTQGIDVDLPKTTSKSLRQRDKPVVITINNKGEIFLNRIRGSQKVLKEQLMDLARKDGNKRPVFLKADKKVPYGLVASVMADIKAAGFNQLGMVTNPKDTR